MMLSRSSFFIKPFVLLLILSFALGAPGVLANEDPEATREETAPQASAVSRSPAPHTTSGVTISWDLENHQFRSPSAEQAARMAEEMRKLLEGKVVAGTKGLVDAEEVEIKTLEDGTQRARLPAHLLNVSVVRLGENGVLMESCTESPESAHEVLSTPTTGDAEEM